MSDPRVDIEALYDAHSTALFAFALNLTRSEADTKDVLQEIFCRLAREPGLLRGFRNPRAFLMKMAYRMVIDQHRRQTVRNRHALEMENIDLFEQAASPDEEHFRQALA